MAKPRTRRSGKTNHVIAVLERRIRGGDYLVAPLPTERDLAAELGVSYMTARKAVIALQHRGLLTRGPTGRLALAGQAGSARLAQVAFLAPAYFSADVMRWARALDQVVSGGDCAVKGHFFAHWDDPALLDILERGDGAFLYPSSEPLSPTLERRIREKAQRLVVIDQDWSSLGIPSLCLSPPRFVQSILDHLAARGHNRIACLSTQPHDAAITGRLAQYTMWTAVHGVPVDLIDEPVPPGQDPVIQARNAFARRLAAGKPEFTALFVTTGASAIGAMRACHEAGIKVGRELAICTLNDDGLGEMLVPSLTTQRSLDPAPFLRLGLDWILNRDRPWQGPLVLQPDACEITERESTAGR